MLIPLAIDICLRKFWSIVSFVGPVLSGMTGNVLINSNANRLSQYYVWSYGPDNDSYYRFMYIDFSQARNKVSYSTPHFYWPLRQWAWGLDAVVWSEWNIDDVAAQFMLKTDYTKRLKWKPIVEHVREKFSVVCTKSWVMGHVVHRSIVHRSTFPANKHMDCLMSHIANDTSSALE